jgi:hypothetical protein
MQISKTLPRVALVIFAASLPLPIAVAKAAHPKRVKLKAIVPIIDTSVIPKPTYFKLKIKHTQIIFPEDPARMLHGENKVVDLRAEVHQDELHGRVAAEEHASIISTHEHGVKPKFAVNLQALAAKFAPELGWLMETKIEEARRREAGAVETERQKMEQELRGRTPVVAPQIPANANASPQDSAALAAKLDEARLREQTAQIPKAPAKKTEELPAIANLGTPKIPLATGQNPEKIPTVPDVKGKIPTAPNPKVEMPPSKHESLPDTETKIASGDLHIPEVPPHSPLSIPTPKTLAAPSIPSIPHTDTTPLQHQMNEEQAIAKLKTPSEPDLQAEVERAKKLGRETVRQAQPVMDAILTCLHKNPTYRMPTASNGAPPVEEDPSIVLEWTKWHVNFARLAHDPILKAIGESGNPAGNDTVEITVLPNHQVTVSLAKSSNRAFDQAMLKAYQSLDGNSDLAYPAGSRRISVTFSIDNKHDRTGAPSDVKSDTAGDKEIVRQAR